VILALFYVAASGFIALSYEIMWFRIYAHVSGGTAHVFGIMLSAYLLGLATGSLAARWFCTETQGINNRSLLTIPATTLLLVSILGFLFVPFVAHFVTYFHYAWTLILVAVLAGLMGIIFPLIAHFALLVNQLTGKRLSWLYLSNILGATTGSLLTGFVFLDILTFQGVSLLLTFIGVLLAAMLFVHSGQRGVTLVGILFFCTLVMIAAGMRASPLYSDLWEKLQYKTDYSNDKQFIQIIENRSGVITVDDKGTVYGDGIWDGKFNTTLLRHLNYIERAYVISGIHPAPKSVLIVGLGSGSWAQVIGHIPTVEKMTIVEINPGYLEVVKSNEQVRSLLTNPKVDIVIDDGRRWLRANPDKMFDAIIQNTTYHWRSHATNLLSMEYQALIKQHLKPGGLSMFNATDFAPAMKTACTAFQHGFRFINNMIVSDTEIYIHPDLWRERLENYQIDGHPIFNLDREQDRIRLEEVLKLKDRPGGWAGEVWVEPCNEILQRTASDPLVTDDNMAPELYRPWWALP